MKTRNVLVIFQSPIVAQGICTVLRALSQDVTITIATISIAQSRLDDANLIVSDNSSLAHLPNCLLISHFEDHELNIFSSLEEIEQALRRSLPYNTRRKLTRDLTPRQMVVAKALSQGMVNKQIADHLMLSEATVRTHISNIFRSLNVNNRTQATNVLAEYFATHLEDEH